MPKKFIVLALLGLPIALAGCGGGGGGSKDPDEESGTPNRYYHRLVHALPDAPVLLLQAGTVNLTAAIDYRQATGLSSRSLGGTSAELAFTIDSVGPSGAAIPDLMSSTFTVQGNTEYSFVATGQFDAPELVVVSNPRRDRPFDGLYFQFVHAAPTAGPVDVYLTAPDTALSSTAPVATLDELEFSQALETAYSDRRIRLTAAGTLDVVFDSGTIPFRDDPNSSEDGIEWLVTVASNVIAGGSPVKLIVSNGRDSQELYQAGEGATLRVGHASELFPAVDVIVGDDFASPLASNLTFTERSAQRLVPAGRVSLNVTPPGNPGTFVYEDTFTVGAGGNFTAFLSSANDEKATFVSVTDARAVSTDARVRFINLAPDSDFFSVYIGEQANDPPLEDDREARDLAFQGFTGQIRLVPGTYQLTLTERAYEPGDDPDQAEETITIGPLPLEAPAGSVQTLVILPPTTEGGPETLAIYDDLLP